MPPAPQSVEWLFARAKTSKPRARRSRAASGAARIAQSSGRPDGTAAVSVRSTRLVSRFPKVASEPRSRVTTSAKARSTPAIDSSGLETMQSPTAATVNDPRRVVVSVPSTRATAASYGWCGGRRTPDEGQRRIRTVVPIGMARSRFICGLYTRGQPYETRAPRSVGSAVPWIAMRPPPGQFVSTSEKPESPSR